MKKLSVKMLLVLFILVAILISISTNVNATSGAVNPLSLDIPATTATPSPTATVAPTATTAPTAVATKAPTSVYSDSSNLPKTGDAEDIAIFLFIAACIVIAVFAFKKYRNYNI